MMNGRYRKLRTALMAVACLTMATPAWAQSSKSVKESLGVYLDGVDKWGCLTTCGGECASFCAVLNTCTGKYSGSAKGCVQNCACRAECYKNVNFFCDPCVTVSCSRYSVSKCGSACYTASGCIKGGSSGSPGSAA